MASIQLTRVQFFSFLNNNWISKNANRKQRLLVVRFYNTIYRQNNIVLSAHIARKIVFKTAVSDTHTHTE